ncbi:MAG: magnesium transporter [Nocardioides sp.]
MNVSTTLPEPSPAPFPGSLDEYVVTNVPTCGPDTTASQLRTMLAGRRYESAADIAVCTDGDPAAPQLLGLIPLETVMAADADLPARDLMDPEPPVAPSGLHREKAAWKATTHGESSLAVINADGSLRGLVPPARFLSVLRAEHDEDLARLGGYLASSASARHAMYEPIPTRLWHRLPWLVLGLVGSAGAASLVDGFEETIASDVRLAFFIPGIVYMADAVGTQTEALVIRGLSVGVPVRRVFGMELFTGLLVGLLLAVITIPTAWLLLGSLQIGFVLGLSLIGACSVATAVAMSLPWLMARLGRDPAFGSGPLATVIQDVLSLLIYFLIATAILG